MHKCRKDDIFRQRWLINSGGGDCINPAQAKTTLFTPALFSVVRTVKEASAVCRSFLDGVVIFLPHSGSILDFQLGWKIWQVPACKMEPRSGYIMQLEPPTHPHRISLEDAWKVILGCLECFWGVWKVFRWFLKSVWKVSEWCLEGVWTVSWRNLDGVWKVSEIWQVPACKMEPRNGYIMQLEPPTHPSTRPPTHPAHRISLK